MLIIIVSGYQLQILCPLQAVSSSFARNKKSLRLLFSMILCRHGMLLLSLFYIIYIVIIITNIKSCDKILI